MMSMVLLFQAQCLRLVVVSIADACRIEPCASAPNSQSGPPDFNRRILLRSVLANSTVIGLASAVLALLAGVCLHLMPLVLQRDGYAILPIFALPLCSWVLVVGVGQVITQHVLSLHQERHYLLVSLCGGALATVLAFWLVPLYGAVAAAYSLLVVNSFTVIANGAKLLQIIRSPRPVARPAKDSADAEGKAA